MKTPHAWDIAYVVSSVLSESATGGEQFQGQAGLYEMKSLGVENRGEDVFDCNVSLI